MSKLCDKCVIVSVEHFENGNSDEIFEEKVFCNCPCEEYTDEDSIKCSACNHNLVSDVIEWQ